MAKTPSIACDAMPTSTWCCRIWRCPFSTALPCAPRWRKAFPDLKVILMTGQTPSAFSLEALPDAPRVLRKPIDHGALRAAIAEASARVGS
nr:hypothetical protein [Thiocapsa sp.]